MDNQLKLPPHSHGPRTSTRVGALRFRRAAARGDTELRRAVAIVSKDESIVNFITDNMSDGWVVESCADPHRAHSVLDGKGVKIVVIDDEAIEESSRGWLLDQVRKRAPHALVAYIAADHSPESERRARAYDVNYYTAKPLDRERTLRVLHAFAGAAR